MIFSTLHKYCKYLFVVVIILSTKTSVFGTDCYTTYSDSTSKILMKFEANIVNVYKITRSDTSKIPINFEPSNGTSFCDKCIRLISSSQDTLLRSTFLNSTLLVPLIYFNDTHLFGIDFESKKQGKTDGTTDIFLTTSLPTILIFPERNIILTTDSFIYDTNGLISTVSMHIRQLQGSNLKEIKFKRLKIPKNIQETELVQEFLLKRILKQYAPIKK